MVSGLEAGATIEYIPTIVVHSTSHVQEPNGKLCLAVIMLTP